MDFTAGLIPLDTALAQMLEQISPLRESESVPLLQAFGRITAGDVISPLDVPGFDNSAMDGYAVRLADLAAQTPLTVAGKAFAGQPFHGEWPAGSCVRIMTGAPIPAGCEAVVMQEETEQTDAGIRFTAPVKPGRIFAVAAKTSPTARWFSRRYPPHRRRAAGAGVSRHCRGERGA